MSSWREIFEAVKRARPFECQHKSVVLGCLTQVNGAKLYKRYCLSCGCPTTSGLPHDSVRHIMDRAVPAEEFRRRQEQFVSAHGEGHSTFKSDVWWALYKAYLESWEWKKIRRAALNRTSGRCDECGAIAEHVHHKTYARIGAEDANDLSPLCASCHAEHHPHMRADMSIYLRSLEQKDAG